MLPAVLATIAQQGQAVAFTAPDETIATTSSGNYNMAMLVDPTADVWPNHYVWSDGKLDGSEFTQTDIRKSTAEVDWGALGFQLFNGGNYGNIQIYCGGYARHGQQGNQYTWVVQNISSSLSNNCTVALASNINYKTVQDCTTINTSGNQGITTGDQIRLTMGGGRGGLTYPAAGDTMEWEVRLEVDDQEFNFTCKVEVTWVS